MGPIDLLLHAGDGPQDLAGWRQANPGIPLRAVAGNCDPGSGQPEEVLFSLGPWKIFLTHGHRYGVKGGLDTLKARGRSIGADLVIFGHTHQPEKIDEQDLILFNPGSLSPTRAYYGQSYGLLNLEEERLTLSLHYLRY